MRPFDSGATRPSSCAGLSRLTPGEGTHIRKSKAASRGGIFISGSAMTTSVLPTYKRAPLAFEHGKGPRLYTEDGKEYLDFGAGVAVTSLGHAHPHLIKALTEQASKDRKSVV